MNIKELQDGMKRVDCEGYIVEMGDIRTVKSRYSTETFEVREALLSQTKDSYAENSVTITLWNEQCQQFRINDKVRITNGYVTTFRTKMQLNIGKFGSIALL